MKPIIYPYKMGSKSAKALAKALDTKCVREKGKYKYYSSHKIINWGNPRDPKWSMGISIKRRNGQVAILRAQNKLHTFQELLLNNIAIPLFSQSDVTAKAWATDGKIVVCRKLLNSSQGKGIVIAHTADEVIQAPLYTLYIKKKKEFRVHVYNGEVIDVQQKRKRKNFQGEVNTAIRNYDNGWVYCRDGIEEPDGLRCLGIDAVKALGLDFGAVDIIWNERERQAYVLEINTAPGLSGTTLTNYAQALSSSF